MKRQPTEWKKIFVNHVSKMLISKIYKESIQLKKKENTQKNPIKKWKNNLSQYFSKDIEIVNSSMKKVLHITSHEWNANKNHKKLSLHTCQNEYYQNHKITNAGTVAEKKEYLCTVGENVSWFSYYGKQYRSYSKSKNRTNVTQQFHFWVFILRK